MMKKYYKNLNKKLNEGILYDKQNDLFSFDFENDTKQDTIYLSSADLVITQFNDNIYAYGYEFNKPFRGKFMTWLKNLTDEGLDEENINKFISNAIGWFNRDIGINNFKCVIYPDSSHNRLLQKIIKTFNTFLNSGDVISYYEIVKNLPVNIIFDWNLYLSEHPNIMEQDLQVVEKQVEEMLDKIHKLDYFSLSKNVSLNKRPYIRNYLTIEDPNCIDDLINLQESENILIIDDANTTGSTLNEILRAINTINNNCNIYIFTLINGNKL